MSLPTDWTPIEICKAHANDVVIYGMQRRRHGHVEQEEGSQSIVVRLTLWECNTSVTIVNRYLVVGTAVFGMYRPADSRSGRHVRSIQRGGTPSGISIRPVKTGLARQKSHSAGHQDGGNPASAVDFLVEEEFRREGVADESKGCGGGGDEADISPRQGKEQAEECERHGGYAKEEIGVTERAANDGPKSTALPQIVHVAHLLHGARQDHVSDNGKENDDENSAPSVEALHRLAPPAAAETTVSCASSCASGWGCAVSAGPLATKLTPPEIRAIPIQRRGLTCSCRANLATRASRTYPSEVAGKT